jgi:DNA-binding SARP family transcriptional activator
MVRVRDTSRDAARAPDGGDALAAAARLLAEGRYGESIDALAAIPRGRAEDNAGPVSAEILEAAAQLSLACKEHRDEAERHRAVAAAATRHEEIERARALALLRLARTGGAAEGARVPPAELRVRCLGPLEVAWGPDAVPAWTGRRCKTLFKYLVLHRRRPVPREVLMDLLWPGASPPAARNRLNVTLYVLRRALPAPGGRPLVRFSEGAYRLDTEPDPWVDIEEFEAVVASAWRCVRRGDEDGFLVAARAAETLYRGDLFEDDPYEEWMSAQRRFLRETYLTAMSDLADCESALGDPSQAIGLYRQALLAEPEREDVHRRLMEAYARVGQRAQALRQFDLCAEALRRRLRAEPSAETVALCARIRRGGG